MSSNVKKHASIKHQILNLFGLSVFILAFSTSILTAWKSSQELQKSTIETGKHLTDNFAKQMVLTLLTASEDNAQDAIEQILGFESVLGVSVYTQDKKLVVTSNKKTDKPISFIAENHDINAKLVVEKSNDWVFSAPVVLQEESYDEMLEITDEPTQTEFIGYVFLQYDKSALKALQSSIFTNNLMIGAVIAIVLSFFIRRLIHRMIKPLITLSKTMEQVSQSGVYTQAKIKGATEIRNIALTYNQMMATLERQNNELSASHNTLESEVEIRTQELIVARDSALTASRHKSEFLANISHELRTPLQAIIGYTDLVKEDLELECMDSQAEDLNKSIRSANNLLALINNILDLAKIEAGKMDLYVKPVNINFLVEETVDTILPMAKMNHNELIVNADKLSSTLPFDRQKLMQIFLNLLSNACKFTKHGKIEFTISNDEHFLYCSVKDSGVGIAKDKLSYIFEQFTQVDGSQTRQFEGTGLGMAITQNFCQLMGGELTVESELSVGSVFSVKLPIKH